VKYNIHYAGDAGILLLMKVKSWLLEKRSHRFCVEFCF